jgi:uncharacterized protein (TIGR02217 family)
MTFQVDSRRLPRKVEAGAQWRITTETHISRAFGGNEDRKAKRAPLVAATVSIGPHDAGEIIDLIRSQIGPRYAFTGRDNSDYIATDQLLEPDDDGNYPLYKFYGTGARQRARRIVLPVAETIVVNLDGNPAAEGSWALGPNGVIMPTISPDQSWASYDVTWSGEFDIPIRIASDDTPITVHVPGTRTIQLQLMEVPVPADI